MKNFWSTFLACLLALVVANVVIGVFLVMVLAGIGTLFSETVPDVQQKTVLRLDFAEPISDDPSRNPLSEMGFNDLISMRVARNYALIDVLKAIETAATDDRISGIYLNVSPNMGMGMATMRCCSSKNPGNSSLAMRITIRKVPIIWLRPPIKYI